MTDKEKGYWNGVTEDTAQGYSWKMVIEFTKNPDGTTSVAKKEPQTERAELTKEAMEEMQSIAADKMVNGPSLENHLRLEAWRTKHGFKVEINPDFVLSSRLCPEVPASIEYRTGAEGIEEITTEDIKEAVAVKPAQTSGWCDDKPKFISCEPFMKSRKVVDTETGRVFYLSEDYVPLTPLEEIRRRVTRRSQDEHRGLCCEVPLPSEPKPTPKEGWTPDISQRVSCQPYIRQSEELDWTVNKSRVTSREVIDPNNDLFAKIREDMQKPMKLTTVPWFTVDSFPLDTSGLAQRLDKDDLIRRLRGEQNFFPEREGWYQPPMERGFPRPSSVSERTVTIKGQPVTVVIVRSEPRPYTIN